jgi:hypothetical protein
MKGGKVLKDLTWAIVQMAPLIGQGDIQAFAGIRKIQIWRILSLWQHTGSVMKHKNPHIKGRPCHLTPQDVGMNVCVAIY